MIGFILKATTALVIFYAFYHAFLVKESMFRFNRFFLIFALCFSMIVPFLQMPFSLQITENLFPENSSLPTTVKEDSGQEEAPAQPLAWEQGETENSLETQPIASSNWNTTFVGIYLLGLILFLTRFFLHLVQLVRLICNNLTIREKECTYVLLSQKTLPFTFLDFLFFPRNCKEMKILSCCS